MKITIEAPFWPCNCGKQFRQVTIWFSPTSIMKLYCSKCTNEAVLSHKGKWDYTALTDDPLAEQIDSLKEK